MSEDMQLQALSRVYTLELLYICANVAKKPFFHSHTPLPGMSALDKTSGDREAELSVYYIVKRCGCAHSVMFLS